MNVENYDSRVQKRDELQAARGKGQDAVDKLPTPPRNLQPAIDNLEPWLKKLHQWRAGNLLLLYLIGHRPFAFVAAQGLHLLSPFAAMAGYTQIDSLAILLDNRQGIDWLIEELGA